MNKNLRNSVILITQIALTGCGARTPEPNEQLENPGARLSHSTFTACNVCHEDTRPPAPHPVGGDCFDCHAYPAWLPLKSNN